MTKKTRVAVFISGRGSNMSALVEAAKDPSYPGKIALVLSNKTNAAGLDFAKENNIKTAVVDHTVYGKNRESFERAIHQILVDEKIELICLAGFMRVLTPWFINQWFNKILNIHPSLLPAFPGLDTHKRALESGAKIHGCTVHYVVPEVDAGKIIVQAKVPVLEGDTEQALAARVLHEEHKLYVEALRIVLQK